MSKQTVALWATCLVDLVMPEVGIATVRLLERFGYRVVYPKTQTCCGQPFFNSGYQKEALALARKTIEILEPYDTVVLPSGSCTAMMRVEYPHLFAGNPAWLSRAEKLAGKTFELGEFLDQQGIEIPRGTPEGRITYHDSCHMCRLLRIRETPRRLLAKAGAELVEMEESDRCCGFGGLFFLKMPEVSASMTAEKLRQAVETGAETLVTADPGCLMQMRGQIEQSGSGLHAKHLAVLLEELSR